LTPQEAQPSVYAGLRALGWETQLLGKSDINKKLRLVLSYLDGCNGEKRRPAAQRNQSFTNGGLLELHLRASQQETVEFTFNGEGHHLRCAEIIDWTSPASIDKLVH
jgi:hypothetical protein